jgi:capsular exopolysaccharide synthesis family protein
MSRKETILMHSAAPADLVPPPAAIPAPVPPARKSNPAPNALALLKALRRRWLLATTCGVLVAALAGAAAWFGMPVKYTASALLHVASHEPRILGGDAQGYGEFAVYQKSQAAMVTSRLVLNTVLKDAEVARLSIPPKNPDQQIDWLQQEIKVDFKTGQEFMRVSMIGDRPEEMKTLLNAVTSVYLKEVVNKERTRKQDRLKYLEKLQSDYDEALHNRRNDVRKLILALGSGDAAVLAVKQRYATEALGAAEKELLTVQSELRRLQFELKVKEAREKATATAPEVPDAVIEQALNKHPDVVQLLANQEKLKKKLERASQLALRGKDEPALNSLRDEISEIEAQLKTTRARLAPEVKQSLRQQVAGDLQAAVIDLRERLAVRADLEKSLIDLVERLRKQTNTTNGGQADVEAFRLEIAQKEKVVERVASEVETLKVEVDAPRRVELLEEASASLGNMERQRIKVTAAVTAVALFLVVGFVAWREYRFRRIDSAHEVANDLGMRVVGALPPVPTASRALLPWGGGDAERWQEVLTECVDATRTSLLHVAREKDVRVVMVTSALGGEGKTSLSCHLAGSLARAGFRTLLIDGDLRRPTVHNVFDVEADAGLSELLREEMEVGEAIHATAVPNLWLIAAGQWDQRATAALARTRLPDVLKALRQHYDYIIIDSAPLLPVVDSLLIGQHADGVLLSVLREVSQMPLVHSAVERLESIGVRILGAIVNGVHAGVHSYRYGYAGETVISPAPEEAPTA